MKESEKRARLLVAVTGLAVGLEDKTRWLTVKQIFPLNRYTKPAESKEAHNRSWQIKVMDRLVQAKIFEKTEGKEPVEYKVINQDELTLILKDHMAGGLKLSWYVFPSEVVVPAVAQEPAELTVEDTEDVKDEATDESSPTEEDGQDPDVINAQVQKFESFMERLLNGQVGIVKALVTLYDSDQKIIDALNSRSERLGGLVAVEEGIKSLRKRIGDLEIKQTETVSLLNGATRAIKDFSVVTELSEEDVTRIALKVQEALGLTTDPLTSKLGRLFNVIADLRLVVSEASVKMDIAAGTLLTREKDRIGTALKQIADLRKDMEAIEGLLTEHMSDTP